MGPNGSGKTTLSYALMGHPGYEIVSGSVAWKGENLLDFSPDQRSRFGLFLAFQYPTAIPGLSVASFLRTAMNARRSGLVRDPEFDPSDPVKGGMTMGEFRKLVKEKLTQLKMDEAFMTRMQSRVGGQPGREIAWVPYRPLVKPLAWYLTAYERDEAIVRAYREGGYYQTAIGRTVELSVSRVGRLIAASEAKGKA